jgi:hypothetical protein
MMMRERGHHEASRGGRHAQVVQPAGLAAELGLRVGDGGRQPGRPRRLRHVLQLGGERGPLAIVEHPVGELVDRPSGKGTEAVGVELVERRPDDAALAHQTGEEQVEQTWQQLASREIAGGAEQHDHVRLHGCHQRRRDVARVGVGGHVLVLGHRRTLGVR